MVCVRHGLLVIVSQIEWVARTPSTLSNNTYMPKLIAPTVLTLECLQDLFENARTRVKDLL